jgi:hypothetical protein
LTAAVGGGQIPLMRRLVILGLLLLAPSSAGATFYTYAQWAALPPDVRSAYITGAYDALVTYNTTPQEEATAKHYAECLFRAKMTNVQLSENVREFAAAHPKFQGSTPQYALVNYLIELCGKAP